MYGTFTHVMLSGVLVWLCACSAWPQSETDGEARLRDQQELQRKKQAEYRELHNRLPELEITGRVVDQDGGPVAGARVTVFWENADELLGRMPKRREDVVKTDSQGVFRLRCDKVVEAKAEAEKEGYAPLSGTARRLVRIHDQMPEVLPAVITLRKRGVPTFLLRKLRTGGHWVRMSTNMSERVVSDLMASVTGTKQGPGLCEDLRANIVYDAVRMHWVVTYEVSGNDGIACFEKCFYEAPLSGYTNSVSLTISSGASGVKRYLCLKSRLPTIYARIEVTHVVSWGPDWGPIFRVFREEICVNPYGERNFEYDERFEKSWRAREELAKEAVAALAEGRYPQKCEDVPARIKEAERRK